MEFSVYWKHSARDTIIHDDSWHPNTHTHTRARACMHTAISYLINRKDSYPTNTKYKKRLRDIYYKAHYITMDTSTTFSKQET
jgi:hypothetical protein